MSIYGAFVTPQCVEMAVHGENFETEFLFTLVCVALGDPGKLSGPYEDCYPPEGAEFELESIQVIDDDGKPVEISEEVLTAVIGKEAFESLLDTAITDAVESGEFG
jgi:hypothetical protein